MAVRPRSSNDNIGGFMRQLQNAGKSQEDIALEEQLNKATYGSPNLPTVMGQPIGQSIGIMSGSKGLDGKASTGLEDIGEKASVDNIFYKKPDGKYAPIKEIAHPKDSKDAITPAKAIPLFTKQGNDYVPAKTFDSSGMGKDAMLVHAQGFDGDIGFQTTTKDELPYFLQGNTDKTKIPDTLNPGWSNEMTVLTTDPAATLNGTSNAAAEARAVRIGSQRNKDLPPLPYRKIDTEATAKAQERENARVAELNANADVKYETLISKYPERADTEQNRARNEKAKEWNKNAENMPTYTDHLKVPSFVNPLRGQAFLGGGIINGLPVEADEVDLIQKPGEIKPRIVDPIMGPGKIEGTYVRPERQYNPRSNEPKNPLLWLQWDSANNALSQGLKGDNPNIMLNANKAYLRKHKDSRDAANFTSALKDNFRAVYKFDPTSTGTMKYLYDLPLRTDEVGSDGIPAGYNLAQGVGKLIEIAQRTDGARDPEVYMQMLDGSATPSEGWKNALRSVYQLPPNFDFGRFRNQDVKDKLTKQYVGLANKTSDTSVPTQVLNNFMFYAKNFMLSGLYGGFGSY